MAFVSPRMSLKVWNSAQDAYDHAQLADNFLKLDQHDHAQGRGTIITGAGIADGSIEARHLYPGAISPALVSTELDTKYIPALVTSLPGSPTDGQEIFYNADATNGIIWHLRYRSASASTYKWEFVGGSPMRQELDNQLTPSVSIPFADIAGGPSLTIPLSGEFLISFHVEWLIPPQGSGSIAPSIGGVTDSTNGLAAFSLGGVNSGTLTGGSSRIDMKRTIAATNIVKLRYTGSAGLNLYNRELSIRPVRVG